MAYTSPAIPIFAATKTDLPLRRAFLYYFFLLLLAAGQTHAQTDSFVAVPGARARYTNLERLAQNPEDLTEVDTILQKAPHFDSLLLRNLGSEGTPAYDLSWDPFRPAGFQLGFHQWDHYKLTHRNIRYFNTQNPYTNLFFVQGARTVQRIEGVHTQNIMPNWNAALHLNRQAAGGWYGNQGTSFGNLGVNSWYRTPNQRYMAIGSAIFNTLTAEENGGIKDLETFNEVSPSDRTRIETWLTEARQRWKEQDFYLQQNLYFGETEEQKINDTFTARVLKPRFYLSHTIHFSKYRYTYTDTDPDTLFYGRVLFDESKISDEYRENKLTNRAAIGYTRPDTARDRVYFIQGYAEHEYAEGSLKDEEYAYGDNVRLGFDGTVSGKGSLTASGYTYLTGYNAGDYSIRGRLEIPFVKALGITHIYALGGVQGYSPTLIQRRFISSQILWSTNVGTTNVIQAGGGLKRKNNAYLEGVYQIADGLVYSDRDLIPVQADTAIHYFRFTLQQPLTIGKFHFDHHLTYQKVIRGDGIRVPDFIWRSSYYFQTYLWKRALLLQLGVDGNYNSAYYAFGYRPGLSEFYRQDTFKVGNYPVVDVWLAGQVQRFHFFAKMEHLNAGFTGDNYFLIPGYPLYPRTYRVGVRWWFYN